MRPWGFVLRLGFRSRLAILCGSGCTSASTSATSQPGRYSREEECTIHGDRYFVTDSKRLESRVIDIRMVLVDFNLDNKTNTIAIFHVHCFDLPKSRSAQ
jgi:hypothetical protein